MPTVYVVQESLGRNLTPALKWGKLKILLPPGGISMDQGYLSGQLIERLKDFTEDDYLLLMGDPVSIIFAGLIAAEMVPSFTMLRWDRQNQDYVPIPYDNKLFKFP